MSHMLVQLSGGVQLFWVSKEMRILGVHISL